MQLLVQASNEIQVCKNLVKFFDFWVLEEAFLCCISWQSPSVIPKLSHAGAVETFRWWYHLKLNNFLVLSPKYRKLSLRLLSMLYSSWHQTSDGFNYFFLEMYLQRISRCVKTSPFLGESAICVCTTQLKHSTAMETTTLLLGSPRAWSAIAPTSLI